MDGPDHAVTVVQCASCGQPLSGRFCAACGERAIDPHDLTVRHFLTHTVAHEFLHLDGKIWLTLRALLFRPGFLTTEYCAGRRNLYINPVRLLITAIILYALLMRGTSFSLRFGDLILSIAPARVPASTSVAETVDRLDRGSILHRIAEAKGRSMNLESEPVREHFHHTLERFAEPLSFANVLLLALALFAVFRRRRPLLVEHGVFSIHIISFVMMSTALVAPVFRQMFRMRPLILPFIGVMMLWQFFYVMAAIRRVYLEPVRGALRRRLTAFAGAVFVYLLNSAFVTAVQLAAAAIALWTL